MEDSLREELGIKDIKIEEMMKQINDQQTEINTQRDEINAQKDEINELKVLIEKMEVTIAYMNNQASQRNNYSKSSYLPPRLRNKEKYVDSYDEFQRFIKCTLNKITPQNLQYCLEEIIKLNIKGDDKLSCLVEEIFMRAIQEEAYSATYAQLCKKLSSTDTVDQKFRSFLLKRCQTMFNTPIQDQLDNVRIEWMLKIDNESDLKIKSLYQSLLEEQMRKVKERYIGNIRFVGDLFLHSLLICKIILYCITELLHDKSNPDAMLALCKLMETCGKKLDIVNIQKMNSFFLHMNYLSESNELEIRIRFRIKDVIDMRKRNWILRPLQLEKKMIPKTREELNKEVLADAVNKRRTPQVSKIRNNLRRQICPPRKSLVLDFSSHVVDNKTALGTTRSNLVLGSGCKPNVVQDRIENQSRFREHLSYDWPEDVNKEVVVPLTDDERAAVIFNGLLLNGLFDVDSFTRIVDKQRIIEKWIYDMMKKDLVFRQDMGDNFVNLLNHNFISHEQLIQSFQTFLSRVDDLIEEIPQLWDFIAEFLERFICDQSSDINFIETIFKQFLPDENVARCISMTLHAARAKLDENIVGQVFRKSSLKWENIVPGDWEKFVDENNLQFTIESDYHMK